MPNTGKSYKELMDQARTEFEFVQVAVTPLLLPAKDGDLAIFSATVKVWTKDSNAELSYTEIGDATPESAENVMPHYIRMAATRAKARALKEALGEGEAAAEEFGGGSGSSQSRQSSSRSSSTRKSSSGRQNQSSQGSEDAGDRSLLPATKKQRSYLENLIDKAVEEDFDGDYDAFEEEYGEVDLEDDDLTRAFASELIEKLR